MIEFVLFTMFGKLVSSECGISFSFSFGLSCGGMNKSPFVKLSFLNLK